METGWGEMGWDGIKDEAVKASAASTYFAWLLRSIKRLTSKSEARAWRMKKGQNRSNYHKPSIHH
jgi:hypothetical protein